MSDGLQLSIGALTLFAPGVLLLLVCRVTDLRVALGLAPAVTIGLLQVAALLTAVTPLLLPWATVVLTAVLLVVLAVLEVRRGRAGALLTMVAGTAARVRHRPAVAGVTAVVLGAAVFLGMTTWTRGLDGLATPPQEHDTVMHSLLTAFIARTGHASPFDVMPVDLATGGNVRYYPAALHTFAGLLAHLTDDPVSGLNAATVLLLSVAAPITLFAAVSTLEGARTRPLFAALAALLSVTMYRPYLQLVHDAGILPFAAGLALAPALVIAVTAMQRRDPRMAAVTAVVTLGLFAMHPSLAVIAATVAAVAVAVCLLLPDGRSWLASRVGTLGLAAGSAVVLVAPWAIPSMTVADSVTGYPETPPSEALGTVTARVAGFFYGGFIDTEQSHFQLFFAVLFWIGLVGCLTRRALWPVAAAWASWALAAVLYASGHADLPGLRQLGQVFFNSWPRIMSISTVIAPAVAALGLAALTDRLVTVLDRRRRTRPGPAHRPPARQSPVPVLVAAALAAAFALTSGSGYQRTNVQAVSERYGDPVFYRVTPEEREAFDYLATEETDVGRVMNNANDGSTFLYVYEGIPVVNTYPLGMPESQYGIYLMQHFNEIGTNEQVRCLVERYDITHVLVSLTSPAIGAAGAPGRWVRSKLFDYAPGFFDLIDVPELENVFYNDDVAVFRVDPAVRSGNDLTACSADPAHPGPPGPSK